VSTNVVVGLAVAKVKDKCHPINCVAGTEREWRYNSPPSLSSVLG
jgi:hypothetical protein